MARTCLCAALPSLWANQTVNLGNTHKQKFDFTQYICLCDTNAQAESMKFLSSKTHFPEATPRMAGPELTQNRPTLCSSVNTCIFKQNRETSGNQECNPCGSAKSKVLLLTFFCLAPSQHCLAALPESAWDHLIMKGGNESQPKRTKIVFDASAIGGCWCQVEPWANGTA